MEPINRYPYGVPSNARFVKVTGADGIFYDLINSQDVKKHIESLLTGGYEAVIAARGDVPPCTLRDFTDGLDSYQNISYNGGGNFYHGGKQ